MRTTLHSAAVLDALTVPPRLIVRALDDLHTLAQGVRRLTDREGDLDALLEAVKALPRTEDELMGVSGVGQHKLARYGGVFLAEIAAFGGPVADA